MQNVSAAYKESMKKPLRDRGYIRVVVGIVNIAAQANARISGSQHSYSDTSMVFKGGTQNVKYAFLEENMIVVGDPNTLFAPSNKNWWLSKCYISADYGSTGNANATISFDDAIDLNRIVINFGDHYPVDFDITDNNGNTYEVRGNDQKIVTVENQFTGVNSLILHVINMIYPDNRLRIYSISFGGKGYLYENDVVQDSSIKYSMSPINENLPQINFSLKLINENHRFDLDNNNSDLSLLDTSSELDVYYGYEVEGDIEWVHGAKLYCADWNADRETATINARDILQNNNVKYISGSTVQTTLYDLAENILNVMGVENYIIDEELRTIVSKNPLPIIDCREALQIVANAASKKLLLTRDGGVEIGDSFTYTLTSNGDYFGKLPTVVNKGTKPIYALAERDLIEVGGSNVYFIPSNSADYFDVGFVSLNKSLSSGYFSGLQGDIDTPEEPLNNNLAILEHTLSEEESSVVDNPQIIITIPHNGNIGSITLTFGAQTCEIFTVESYSDDVLLESISVNDNHLKTVTVTFNQPVLNKIVITFIKTEKPETRIYLNYLELNRMIGDYQLIQQDMLTAPLFNRLKTIKEIEVPYYSYQLDTTEQQLAEEEFQVSDADEEFTVYMNEPCSAYRLSVSSGMVTITRYDCHYVKFRFTTIGDKTLIIYGKKYNRIVQTYTKSLRENGDTVRWENPLIYSKTMAQNLAENLAEYYTAKGIYEYETRGNPELDVNDLILQEHWDGKKLKVLITEAELNFDGAFSGSVKALRVKEE